MGDRQAGFRQRLIAFLWDYLVILAYIVLLVAINLGILFSPARSATYELFSQPARADLMAFVTLVLPVMLYFVVTESSMSRGSWGKRRVGLEVVTADGQQLGFGRSCLRSALKFLPWQLAHTCLFHFPGWPLDPQTPPLWVTAGFVLVWVLVAIYILGVVASRSHRTLYDQVSGSWVVVADTEVSRIRSAQGL